MRGRASEQTPIGFAGRGGPDFARHDRAKGVAGFGRITAVAPAKAGAAVVLRSGAGISLQRPPPSRGRRVMQYPLPTPKAARSEEQTSELQSLMRISYAVFCLQKKNQQYLPITTQ